MWLSKLVAGKSMKVKVPEATKCRMPILDLFSTQKVISVSCVLKSVKASLHSGLEPFPQHGIVFTHCSPRVISHTGSFCVNNPVLWSKVARSGLILTSCPLVSILGNRERGCKLRGFRWEAGTKDLGKACRREKDLRKASSAREQTKVLSVLIQWFGIFGVKSRYATCSILYSINFLL